MLKAIKKHYYWILLGVMVLLMAIRGGIYNNMSGLHQGPVTEGLGITPVQFSLAVSAYSVVAMLSNMFSGTVIQRFGYRPMLGGLFLFSAACFALMSKANTYGVFLLGFTLVGVTAGVVGDAGAARLVSVWFHKHRGVVMGIVASSTGIGSTIVCILQTAAIERSGFRASYFLAAALLVSCAVIAILFVRSHPAKMGMLPYGDGEKVEYKKREHDDHWHGLPMKRLVRRPTFYMMLFGTLLSATLPYLAYYVLVPHLQDKGLSFAKASSLQSILMLALTGAKLMNGYLCDKIGAKKVEIMCICFNIVALVLLATAKSYGLLLVAVILFAVGLTAFSVIIPLLGPALFGYQAQASYNGIFFAMISAAGILASPISNAIYGKIDNTYSPIFLVAAGLLVVIIGMYLLMYRLADRDRKMLAAEEIA